MWLAGAISGHGIEKGWSLLVLLILLLVLGGLLEYLFLSRYKHKRRTEVLSRTAREMGYSFAPAADCPAEGLHLLQHCVGGQYKNVIAARVDGREMRIFDHEYFVDCGGFLGEFQHTVAAFHVPSLTFPEVYIHPAHLPDKIGLARGARIGTHVVDCPSIRLRPPLCHEIEELPGKWWVEHAREWLLIYQPNVLVKPAEFPQFITEARAIAGKLITAATAPAVTAS